MLAMLHCLLLPHPLSPFTLRCAPRRSVPGISSSAYWLLVGFSQLEAWVEHQRAGASRSWVIQGIPWWASGSDPTLSTQGAWVRSLASKLRSHMTLQHDQKIEKKKMMSYLFSLLPPCWQNYHISKWQPESLWDSPLLWLWVSPCSRNTRFSCPFQL